MKEDSEIDQGRIGSNGHLWANVYVVWIAPMLRKMFDLNNKPQARWSDKRPRQLGLLHEISTNIDQSRTSSCLCQIRNQYFRLLYEPLSC